MDEIFKVAKKIKQLEACGDLRVVYANGIGANAFVMVNTDKFAIVIDPSLSYEQQLKEILHEAKHICSHLNTDYSVYDAECEAENFSDYAINHIDIINDFKKVDDL